MNNDSYGRVTCFYLQRKGEGHFSPFTLDAGCPSKNAGGQSNISRQRELGLEMWVAARPWEIWVRFQGPMTRKTNGQPYIEAKQIKKITLIILIAKCRCLSLSCQTERKLKGKKTSLQSCLRTLWPNKPRCHLCHLW